MDEQSEENSEGAPRQNGHAHDDCAHLYERCAILVRPWATARRFAESGWDRLSGVIGPRDTDRGLRGGI
ncbi:MAG: hypothetical protein ACJ8LI_12475 [Chthoniobacterales bacterium]